MATYIEVKGERVQVPNEIRSKGPKAVAKFLKQRDTGNDAPATPEPTGDEGGN